MIQKSKYINCDSIELDDDEISVLKHSLKHGLLLRSKENEMIAVMEDIFWIKLFAKIF